MLVYPLLHAPGHNRAGVTSTAQSPHCPTTAEMRYLIELLGGTRAQVPHTIGETPTTAQIARRLGVSVASASRHATALRNAGLTTAHRHRGAVVHHLTRLGADLARVVPARTAFTPDQRTS